MDRLTIGLIALGVALVAFFFPKKKERRPRHTGSFELYVELEGHRILGPGRRVA